MQIRLLGIPEILSDEGLPCPVRGLQTWSVLARVLLSERPISRRQMAAELFPETVDPLGALRWCLAALRRALGPEALVGDPVCANLPATCRIDVLDLDADDFDILSAGELLQDSAPDACGADFETWLLVERARCAARVDARLRRDALAAVAREDATAALRLARHLVNRQPFDEGAHVLLIRGLILIGDTEAARNHAERTEIEFLRELGELPSPALRSAARARLADSPLGPTPEAVIRTLLQSGVAALNVGATDAGIDNLRRAATLAATGEGRSLQAEALTELGTALIHSVRSQDDEGVIHLRRAETLALETQNRPLACRAVLEQCYVDALAGRRPDAARLSERALDLAGENLDCLSTTHAFAGFNLADWGRHAEADRAYDLALASARQGNLSRREGWALGLGAWGKLRANKPDKARDWALSCLDICNRLEWLSFRPWPEAVFAEAALETSADPAEVRHTVQPTLAMACQLSDPCWEAATCRVIALSHQKEGAAARALSWLSRAEGVLGSVTDHYAALMLRIRLDRVRIMLAQDPEAGQSALRSLIMDAARQYGETELEHALALRASVGRESSAMPFTQ